MARAGQDESALLRAVCAAPDDDLPRLVYADWLEENGRPERARFIRLQIEDSRPDDSPFPIVYRGVRTEAQYALLTAHGQDWFRELPKWVRAEYGDDPWTWPDFERGFMSSFRVSASPFVKFGGQLTERTPVDSLLVVSAAKLMGELAACTWLWRIRTLHFNFERLGDDGVRELLGSPYLPALQTLDLSGCGVTDAVLKYLARSGGPPELRVLRLRSNDVTEAGVRALSESRYLRELAVVDVTSNPRTERSLERLRRECRFAVEGG